MGRGGSDTGIKRKAGERRHTLRLGLGLLLALGICLIIIRQPGVGTLSEWIQPAIPLNDPLSLKMRCSACVPVVNQGNLGQPALRQIEPSSLCRDRCSANRV